MSAAVFVFPTSICRAPRPSSEYPPARRAARRAGNGGCDLDFNVLGIWFRVFFDIGIREQDHRGMVKATGSAA